MKPHSTIKWLLVPFILTGLIALASEDEQTDQAVIAAKAWLGLVDAKQYKESWLEAAPFFKDRISENDWVKMISLARGPFCDLKSRELKRRKICNFSSRSIRRSVCRYSV